MNDEIKEILDMLRKYGSTNDKVLLDYITNLQQKYEKLDNRYKNSCEEYQRLVEELTEENERLKEEKSLLESDINNAYSWLENYKSRVKKQLNI